VEGDGLEAPPVEGGGLEAPVEVEGGGLEEPSVELPSSPDDSADETTVTAEGPEPGVGSLCSSSSAELSTLAARPSVLASPLSLAVPGGALVVEVGEAAGGFMAIVGGAASSEAPATLSAEDSLEVSSEPDIISADSDSEPTTARAGPRLALVGASEEIAA